MIVEAGQVGMGPVYEIAYQIYIPPIEGRNRKADRTN